MTTVSQYDIVTANTADELSAAVNAMIALGAATGTVTITGAATANDTITIGDDTYTWKASASSAFEVTLSATVATAAANLAAKVNAHSASVSATSLAGVVTLTAKVAGELPVLSLGTNHNISVSGSGTLDANTTTNWQPIGSVAIAIERQDLQKSPSLVQVLYAQAMQIAN